MIAANSDSPAQLADSRGIRYEELFRDAGDAMLLVSDVVVDCNTSVLKLFRARRDQIAGCSLEDLYPEKQLDGRVSSTAAAEYSVRAGQGEIQRYDWTFRRPDGSSFHAGVTLSRVGDHGGGYRLAILRPPTIDSTDELLRERTAQLEAVTSELDAFSYAVSHDLRAAIMGIAACSQIVVNDFGAGLSEEVKSWLGHIHEDSVQLDKFTEALLELSRVSRKPLDPADLNLTSMAREIAGNLARGGSDRTIEFQVHDGLKARGDSALVRTLLQHLLENAWKFTGKTYGARIELGCFESDSSSNCNNRIFYVRDNGPGFDMAHADRLFVAFQRLHRDPDFPGNGVGLALVRRIAHRHGGKAWGEGAPGTGATFFFTLGDAHLATLA